MESTFHDVKLLKEDMSDLRCQVLESCHRAGEDVCNGWVEDLCAASEPSIEREQIEGIETYRLHTLACIDAGGPAKRNECAR